VKRSRSVILDELGVPDAADAVRRELEAIEHRLAN